MPAGELKALIIDDQKTMRSIIRGLLSQLGIKHVEEAENSCLALELLYSNQQNLDFIICDLYMDKGGGIDLLNQFRCEARLRDMHIPIILLTGETDQMVLDVSRQVGASQILTKPCSVGDLGAAIGKAVGYDIVPLNPH